MDMALALSILLAGISVGTIHESGHYLAALYFGSRLKFRFAWGRFGVPRFVWEMPRMEYWKQRLVALAGFGAEFLAAIVLLAAWHEFGRWYAGVAVAHLATYRWYAGEASDFRWFRR